MSLYCYSFFLLVLVVFSWSCSYSVREDVPNALGNSADPRSCIEIKDYQNHNTFIVFVREIPVNGSIECYLYDDRPECIDTFTIQGGCHPFLAQLDSGRIAVTFDNLRGHTDYLRRAEVIGVKNGVLQSQMQYTVVEKSEFLKTLSYEEDSVFYQFSEFGCFSLLDRLVFGCDAIVTYSSQSFEINEEGDTMAREEISQSYRYFFDNSTFQFYTEKKSVRSLNLNLNMPADTTLLCRAGLVYINSEWRNPNLFK